MKILISTALLLTGATVARAEPVRTPCALRMTGGYYDISFAECRDQSLDIGERAWNLVKLTPSDPHWEPGDAPGVEIARTIQQRVDRVIVTVFRRAGSSCLTIDNRPSPNAICPSNLLRMDVRLDPIESRTEPRIVSILFEGGRATRVQMARLVGDAQIMNFTVDDILKTMTFIESTLTI